MVEDIVQTISKSHNFILLNKWANSKHPEVKYMLHKLAISLNTLRTEILRAISWKLDNVTTCLNIVIFTYNKVSRILREHTLTNIIQNSQIKNINKNRGTFPLNDKEFGYWLAGLIEADGCFSYSQISIAGDIREITMLETLSKRIGGKVTKVKNKNACKLVIGKAKDIESIFYLINGKLRYQYKIDMLKNNVLSQINLLNHLLPELLSVDSSLNLDKTHWLAGFTTGDGSFQIKILKRSTSRTEARLNYQIDQKSDYILNQIKECFGGNVYYRSKLDVYSYGSTSFYVSDKFVNYFDKYRVCGLKWVNYLKWRSAWLIIQNKQHLTDSGLLKLNNIKNNMNNMNDKFTKTV